jgi:thioredoxin reductase (NADPH)
MSDYLVREIAYNPRISVRTGTEVVDGGGDGRLEWLDLRDRDSGAVVQVPAAAIFVLIGATPHSDWLPASIARDEQGFVLTGRDGAGATRTPSDLRERFSFETSLPGVFAVGDIRHGSVKRVASSVGEGSVAIQQVHAYLASITRPQAVGAAR